MQPLDDYPRIAQIDIEETLTSGSTQHMAQCAVRIGTLGQCTEVNQFGFGRDGGDTCQSRVNMIIGLIGKNLEPMSALRSEAHLNHTGGMDGIELHAVRGEPRVFQYVQYAGTRLIQTYACNQHGCAAKGAQVPGNIEWRSPQHFPVRKPVYQNFAK